MFTSQSCTRVTRREAIDEGNEAASEAASSSVRLMTRLSFTWATVYFLDARGGTRLSRDALSFKVLELGQQNTKPFRIGQGKMRKGRTRAGALIADTDHLRCASAIRLQHLKCVENAGARTARPLLAAQLVRDTRDIVVCLRVADAAVCSLA